MKRWRVGRRGGERDNEIRIEQTELHAAWVPRRYKWWVTRFEIRKDSQKDRQKNMGRCNTAMHRLPKHSHAQKCINHKQTKRQRNNNNYCKKNRKSLLKNKSTQKRINKSRKRSIWSYERSLRGVSFPSTSSKQLTIIFHPPGINT